MSQRDLRALMAGLCSISALVFVSRGLPTLRSWEANHVAEARIAAEQLANVHAGRRVLSSLHDSLRARHARSSRIDSTLLSGTNATVLAARLASTVEDLAVQNDVKITAVQLRADSVVKSRLARVAVRLTGVTDVVGLTSFLRAVERSATPFVVMDLTVSQQDPTGPDTKPEILRIEVSVASIGLVAPDAT